MKKIKELFFPTVSFSQFVYPPCQYCGKVENDSSKITRRFYPWEDPALSSEEWIKKLAAVESRRSEEKGAFHTCRECRDRLEKGRRLDYVRFMVAAKIRPYKRATWEEEIEFLLAGNSHLSGNISPMWILIGDEEMKRYVFFVTSPKAFELLLTDEEKGDLAFFKQWDDHSASRGIGYPTASRENGRYKPGTPGDSTFTYTVGQEKLAVYECGVCRYREARWGEATVEKQKCPVCSFLEEEGHGKWKLAPIMEFCPLSAGEGKSCGVVKTGEETYLLLSGRDPLPIEELSGDCLYLDHQAPYYAEGTEYVATLKDGTSQTIFVEEVENGLFGENWDRLLPEAAWLTSC